MTPIEMLDTSPLKKKKRQIFLYIGDKLSFTAQPTFFFRFFLGLPG
jgi:hypothetical protein